MLENWGLAKLKPNMNEILHNEEQHNCADDEWHSSEKGGCY